MDHIVVDYLHHDTQVGCVIAGHQFHTGHIGLKTKYVVSMRVLFQIPLKNVSFGAYAVLHTVYDALQPNRQLLARLASSRGGSAISQTPPSAAAGEILLA